MGFGHADFFLDTNMEVDENGGPPKIDTQIISRIPL